MKQAYQIETARRAAQAGAAVILNRFRMPQKINVKPGSKTLVTETDLEAESAIIHILKSESDYRILSEESGHSGTGDGPVWVIDPLDGTSNFARSLPFFAVSVALVLKDKLLTGVVIDPVHNTEYYAVCGSGAFFNNKPLAPVEQVDSTPIFIVNHGSLSEDKLKFAELTNTLAPNFNLRKFGATALELCYAATGYFDGFICAGDEIWDYAAGALIAAEAGYQFTDWQGNRWNGTNNSIVVCRPQLQEELLFALSKIL